MSKRSSVAKMSLANFLIDAKDVKSKVLLIILLLLVIEIILSLDSVESSLSAIITLAPLDARSRAVS